MGVNSSHEAPVSDDPVNRFAWSSWLVLHTTTLDLPSEVVRVRRPIIGDLWWVPSRVMVRGRYATLWVLSGRGGVVWSVAAGCCGCWLQLR